MIEGFIVELREDQSLSLRPQGGAGPVGVKLGFCNFQKEGPA